MRETISPEFEKKVQQAAAAPSPDPAFVSRLRARVIAAERPPHHTIFKGTLPMRTRYMIPALAAVLILVVAAFFVINPPTTASAQQILDRASAVQSAIKNAGIWHTRIEIEHNYQVFGGQNTKEIFDTYEERIASGPAPAAIGDRLRSLTLDGDGSIKFASSRDGAYTYFAERPENGVLTISRATLNQDDIRKAQARAADPAVDPNTMAKSAFDQFRANPHVRLEGKVTWSNGAPAYVLVDDAYRTEKAQDGQSYTGSMKMVFNANTYALLATQTSIRKDGKDIIIDASNFVIDEPLPAGATVAWDLSDLPGAKMVDKAPEQPADPQFEELTVRDLAAHAHSYILKETPAGYTLKLVAVANQPADQDFAYEANYNGPSGEMFWLQAIGKLDAGFVESNFYDGSYKAASGLVLHYGTSTKHTNGMLVTPDGYGFLLTSSLPREKVQELVENVVPVK